MATIPWLADVLRQAGLPVVEHGDWRNRMRSGSFDPIGVLWHHTAAWSSASNPHPALNTVIYGRSDLPGPLCHALVDYHGVFHIISAGRANHAGTCRGSGPIPAGDGNTMLIGWEIDYDGQTQQMTSAQYNNSVIATAAVLRQLGRDANHARGHRETSTTGKIDPSFVDLDRMRADVAARMNPMREFGMPSKRGVTYGQSTQIFGVAAGESRELYQRVFVPGEGWRAWTGLGGQLLGQPAVVLYGDQLQVYGRGMDSNVWQLVYNPGEGWRQWANIGGGPVTSDPVAIVNDGNLNVFARNSSGNVIYRPYQPGHGWHDWANLGGQIVGAPSVCNYGFQCQIYARGTDNGVYQMFYDQGWHGWNNVGGGPITTDPVPVVHGGNLNVFARNTSGNVIYRPYQPGYGWHNWDNLGGQIVGNLHALDYGGYFQLFAFGTDNNLYQKSYTPGVGWHDWNGHAGGPFTHDPVAVIFGQYLNVFCRRSAGNITYLGFDPNAGWQAWYDLGGALQ